MLQTTNLGLTLGGRKLFEDVNIKFTPGNCYGVIGANGAGKSTFLKLLSGELESTTGSVSVGKNERISVLRQNQNEFDEFTVLDTVLRGHARLVEVMLEKDALYCKPDFSDEDGIRVSELEEEFASLGGWEAESEAQILLNSLDIPSDMHYTLMADVDAKVKVKVLLAQALFGNPDVLILDEPTNNLDARTIRLLEDFLLDFNNTVIIVSHNRHFLNKVCTYICDVDFGKISVFIGNYDFWYQSSQLLARQARDANKKMEARIKELQEFIARFSANASKSKQATSRKRELEKITLEDIKPSLRKYPYVDFKFERDTGNEILHVKKATKAGYFENISFDVHKGDKIAFVCNNSLTLTMLFDCLMGEEQADSGIIYWGKTVNPAYLPSNNDAFFDGCDKTLVDWLAQYSPLDTTETFLRGWLGRMLFSGDEALKKAKVLSGGEKVRCMLSRMMLSGANFLIFDEPTNHLDLESITSLNTGMTNFKACILFTSHDYAINETVANRIIEITDGRITMDRMIDYNEYMDIVTKREMQAR